MGLREDIIGMDCKTAVIRYIKLAGRINCSNIALGKKVRILYFVV
jgi:hypothetical protein